MDLVNCAGVVAWASPHVDAVRQLIDLGLWD